MTEAPQIVSSPEEGQVEMIVYPENGRIVQRFRRPMNFIIYEPDNARIVAARLIDCAFEADDQPKPAGDAVKAALVQRHRRTLLPRVTAILRSMREEKTKTNEYIAAQVIDAVFHEVFA